MSLMQFHKDIGGKLFYRGSTTIGNWWLGGNFQNLSNPNVLWYNGSTYAVGYEENTSLNAVWIVKQTGINELEKTKVNDGVTGEEPNNHPTPLLVIDDSGYIYVLQCEFHVEPFRVWKSDNPEDITAFTRLSDFGGDYSYLGLLKSTGSTCKFVTREGNAGSGGYDQFIINVDLSSPAGYSDFKLSETDYGTSNVRHYPICPWRYGTSDYYVGGIAHRKDGTVRYFKNSIWITQDFETFENIEQTFSKDVPATSALTEAELESNFTVIGTDSDVTNNYGEGRVIQINNDIYMIAVSNALDQYTIYHYTIGTGLISSYDLPISIYFDDDGSAGISGINCTQMWYNGTNIIISAANIDDGGNRLILYSIKTDLTNFREVKVIEEANGLGWQLYFGMPQNFDQINGKYLCIGRTEIGETNGNVPYIITDNLWF